ncbi:hypothetical protein SYNPS1DRAFT_23573 [Syncephalis pseudoplumigaleata]|uniref:Uncharacterized protein n=1 Tax=Syncephalis pseudoplumigaleata TaxID=1712513 RepID=A0A4P9YWA0_9FUNG|nr:hypothetical protein SYNPS1DRAFT_23573 [Syncephalis pseudoplumigaleata]|eukprot:RKP24336.1 hypothetical protein SYNPS1DRAFT_23573 [Syncephalis pseudoplumigaleata]
MRFHQFSLSVIASIASGAALGTEAESSNGRTDRKRQKLKKLKKLAITPPQSPPLSPLSPLLPLSPASQSTLDKIRQQIEEEAMSQRSPTKDVDYASNPKLQPVPARYTQTYTMQQLRFRLFPTLISSRTALV